MMMMLTVYAAAGLVLGVVQLVHGECVVESQRCDFPFQVEEETYYGCMEGDETGDRYYCKTQIGEKYVTGVCNGGCFEKDGSPAMFNATMGDEVMALFCKTYPSPCMFPFIWQGREYRECTTDGDSPYPWCALEVDDQGNLVDKRWGKCDMSTCDPVSAMSEESEPQPKSLTVSFSEFSGSIELSQASPEDSLQFTGDLEGLPDGDLFLSVVDKPCGEPLDSFVDNIIKLQSLPSSEVKSESWSLSLYPGDQFAVGRSLIVKEKDTAMLNEEGALQLGEVVACTPIQEQSNALSLTLIIIIVVVAVVILLIIIIVCVCCCCCKRRKKKSPEKMVDSIDSIDDPIGNGDTKIPLYDELSIPFIDASLPPTPKMGRSRDQLAILLGGGSKTSLSNPDA